MSEYYSLFVFLNQFIPVSVEEFSELKAATTIRHFAKSEQISKAGDTDDHLYFIVNGLIRGFFLKGKQQVTTSLICEGTITGAITSFFTGQPSRYFLQAMEKTTVLILSKNDLEKLYKSNRKWEKLGRVLITHFFLQREMHILDNIRFSVRERFVKFVNENPTLIQRLPQIYLASYLNIKPETFSRMKHLIHDKRKTV